MIIFVSDIDYIKEINAKITTKYQVIKNVNQLILSKKEIKIIEIIIFINQPVNEEFVQMCGNAISYSIGEKNSDLKVMKMSSHILEVFLLKNNIINNNQDVKVKKNNVGFKIIILLLFVGVLFYGFLFYRETVNKDNYNYNFEQAQKTLMKSKTEIEEYSLQQRKIIEEIDELQDNIFQIDRKEHDGVTNIKPVSGVLASVSQIMASLEVLDLEVLERSYQNNTITCKVKYGDISKFLKYYARYSGNIIYQFDEKNDFIEIKIQVGGKYEDINK